jgi:polyisoprenoid-binding protein YceI
MKAHLITSLYLLLFCLAVSNATAQVFSTKNGDVVFLSEAPLETIRGTSSNLSGQIDFKQNIIDFYVDLATVTTGVRLRDEHMRENYLETSKFPFAEFTGKFTAAQDFMTIARVATRDTQLVKIEGNFTIHGITAPLQTDGKVYIRDNAIFVSASFDVSLAAHQIKIPPILAKKVAAEQRVTVKAKLVRSE